MLFTILRNLSRYFLVKRNRQHLRAWIAEDGALVLLVKRGSYDRIQTH
jgi:hypothetical protein